MRHRKKVKKLCRDRDQRRALVRNLARSLVFHEEITTTAAKATETARLADRLVTMAKKGTLHDRRQALRYLGDKALTQKLFSAIAPRYTERNGGYTQVIKAGYRQGDNAARCKVRFV